VISLLNCLGKVSKRILAKRLNSLAESGPLLHDSEIGKTKKKSAVDIALLLTKFVEKRKLRGLKPLVVFLDIKGAFNYVAKGRLLMIMQSLRLPKSLLN
jgi:hypothetical protein